MNRNPPEEVKRLLRKEVNYGCPVKGCGSPFLSWHHFDPPWSVREHHNVDGMIALCTKCHPMADSGAFSINQLRELKKNPNPIEYVKTKFPWMPENSIIRLGGCYALDWCKVSVSGEPIFWIEKDDNNLLVLNLILKNKNNDTIAVIKENICSILSKKVFDLSISASANRIKIWSEKRKIGIDFRFSRKTINEIEKIIQKDTPIMPSNIGQPDLILDIEEFYNKLALETEIMPNVAAIGMERHDAAGTIIRWHIARNIGEDNKIPVMELVNCRLFNKGRLVEFRDGHIISNNMNLYFCAGNTFSF